MQLILAVETSCDDTSVAVVRHDGFVLSLCSAHQDLVHRPFGGIVPEIASRNHTEQLLPLIERALSEARVGWDSIDGLAVTSRPGLIGSLIVGLVTVKTLALAKNLPFVGVNHLEAHLLAPFLSDKDHSPPKTFDFPYLALAISGGHTHLYEVRALNDYWVLGQTVDDAAGEAFDKFAKMVGLGFPGGVQVDRLAQQGDPRAFEFPRPKSREENFDFSFSGLKTAAQRMVQQMDPLEVKNHLADLCASYQEAIVDSLLSKLKRAVEKVPKSGDSSPWSVVLTGGVSANSRLREAARLWAEDRGVHLVVPPPRFCTDNAAMVGYAGIQRLRRGEASQQDLAPSPRLYEGDFHYTSLSPRRR